jgi:hypothetical protein
MPVIMRDLLRDQIAEVWNIDQGLGSKLFELAKLAARQRGAKRLYISATRSENTVNFYMRLGCTLVKEPDPGLFALEPVDIHLEMKI